MPNADIKIAAVVVLYNTSTIDLSRLRPRIGENIQVIIADNSEPQLEQMPRFQWCAMGGNRGVGAALNDAIELASDIGCGWVLLLDQDSQVPHDALLDYVERALTLPGLDRIAVIAPNLGDDKPMAQTQDVDIVITSGSLVNTKIWSALGGFSEELFVDEVDHEYCLRAKSRGYRVVRLGEIVLAHIPGEVRTVAGGKVVDWHSPQRLYYIARNYWYLKRLYQEEFPDVIAGRRKLVLAKFKAYLRYHPNKIKSIGALLKGTIHGLTGRYGR